MASQSRKHRGYRSQAVVAAWFRDHGWPWSEHEMGTALSRLAGRVLVNGECWEYDGARVNGYGRMFIGMKRHGTGRIERAHRVAWLLAYGPIPEGQCVCHRCDNRACCRPEHLFLGTVAENIRDMDQKGRRVNTPHPGEANGRALLTVERVREIRSSDLTPAELAGCHGLSRSAIYSILKRKTWKWVT